MALKIRRGNPNRVAIIDPVDSLTGDPLVAFDDAVMEVTDKEGLILPGAEALPMALGTILVKVNNQPVVKPALIGTIPPDITADLDLRSQLAIYCTVNIDAEVGLFKELAARVVANSS